MRVPDEHIIDPWAAPLGLAREAIAHGAEVVTNFDVAGIERTDTDNVTQLHSTDGRVLSARFVVNAAGLRGDRLHRMFGHDGFTIRPRRGELIVFDKLARPLVHRTILPVPTSHTKGVLIAPTVFGNVMLGPTADDIDDIDATATTRQGLDGLLAKAKRMMPLLLCEQVTATYAGLRAATEHSDYQLSAHATHGYVCLGGIRSTGLTASMALGEAAHRMLTDIGFDAPVRRATTASLPTIDNPDSHIVCHCERVAASSVVAACTDTLPATDLDGVRRRTRATNGRCQGFACLAAVCDLASSTTGRPMSEWLHTPEATP
jgi:glycerol-3-phosphate dehydrogenase